MNSLTHKARSSVAVSGTALLLAAAGSALAPAAVAADANVLVATLTEWP